MSRSNKEVLLRSSNWPATAPWRNLRLRADLLRRLRAFFESRDFLEVETPQLSSEAVVETHIDPLAVPLRDDPRGRNTGRPMWLQASPEGGMKRLLASAPSDVDAPRSIYQIARAFRGGESGHQHNVEFTLAEWYCLDQDMPAAMQLLADLCQALLENPTENSSATQFISYRQAFLKHAEIDPLTAETHELVTLATASGVAAPPQLGDDRDAWLDLLLTDLVLPRFSPDAPTILYDYPASQAALARIGNPEPAAGSLDTADSLAVAKRFELFYGEVELANGYWELLDADELRRRSEAANLARRADGRAELPIPERLLASMESGLPSCSGCALGIDRVVMLAAGAESIEEVIALPTSRA